MKQYRLEIWAEKQNEKFGETLVFESDSLDEIEDMAQESWLECYVNAPELTLKTIVSKLNDSGEYVTLKINGDYRF